MSDLGGVIQQPISVRKQMKQMKIVSLSVEYTDGISKGRNFPLLEPYLG